MTRKLRRVTEHKWLGGVCSGIAYALGAPVWVVRLVWTALAISFGIGVVTYILFWIFMPKWEDTPDDFETVTGE